MGPISIELFAYPWDILDEGEETFLDRCLDLGVNRVHAAVSAYMEVAAGFALLLGLLVPFAAAAGVGVMTTAFVTVHRKNGFFIFNEGEGYEYVASLAFALVALSVLGAGKVSIDHAIGFTPNGGWVGLAVAVGGVVGAGLMLATSWRPPRS